ncbi:hypothetical protein ACKVWC_010128 [Pyricularia oryzae]
MSFDPLESQKIYFMSITVTTLQQKSYNMRRKDFGIKLLMNVNLQAPSLDPSQAPFDYVCSLKSKNVRNKLVGGLALWIPMPAASCELVASLMCRHS